MNRRILLSSFIGLFSFLATSCTESSKQSPTNKDALSRGPEGKEAREVQAFDAVIADGRVDVRVMPGATKVAQLAGPENYLEHLTLTNEVREIEGQKLRVLVVSLQESVQMPLPQIEVTTSQLKYAKATGPARLKIGNFSSESLTIEGDGATRVDLLPATYGFLKFDAKMAARILAPEVAAERAELSASDISSIQVGQVAQLKKKALGGKISYQGSPELLQP